jgi:L-rhamnose mutarotase
MYRTEFAMTLRPGGYAGYKKAHDNLWPEIAELLAKHNVNMIIYRDGQRLILHARAPSVADFQATEKGADFDRWRVFMTEFLETDAEGNVLTEPLETAFEFGDYASS